MKKLLIVLIATLSISYLCSCNSHSSERIIFSDESDVIEQAPVSTSPVPVPDLEIHFKHGSHLQLENEDMPIHLYEDETSAYKEPLVISMIDPQNPLDLFRELTFLTNKKVDSVIFSRVAHQIDGYYYPEKETPYIYDETTFEKDGGSHFSLVLSPIDTVRATICIGNKNFYFCIHTNSCY